VATANIFFIEPHHTGTTIEIRSEFRNVGDAAYAMTNLSADTCTQRLAADQGVVTGMSSSSNK